MKLREIDMGIGGLPCGSGETRFPGLVFIAMDIADSRLNRPWVGIWSASGRFSEKVSLTPQK